MKIRDGYLKEKIGDKYYIIPYGQNIVNNGKKLELNEAGSILWDGILAGGEEQELIDSLMEYYDIDEGQRKKVAFDVEGFICKLSENNMLMDGEAEYFGYNPRYFEAGNIVVSYKGPGILFDRYFSSFEVTESDNIDLTVQISHLVPKFRENGKVILRNDEIVVIENKESFIFLFPGNTDIFEMKLYKSGECANIYIDGDMTEKIADDVFHIIRFAFLLKSSEEKKFFIHSASIVYRDRVWLFSGSSGTGKSTHTNFWREEFDVEIFNGDLNMLGIEDGEIIVYGQPWCGTSGICSNRNKRLGGIVFLEKWDENICKKLTKEDGICLISDRIISPSWKRAYLKRNINFSKKIANMIPIWKLNCIKDKSAAYVMRRAIDECVI